MLIDTHTHIHFPVYDADREAVIKRARETGVKMICVGTQAASSEAAVQLAKKYPGEIWATAGFHPNHLASSWYHDRKEQREAEREQFDAERLWTIAKNPEVVAIGECGLDYYRLTNPEKEKRYQREAFEAQIEVVKDLNKALMIHCRPSKGTDDAYEDMLEILKSMNYTGDVIIHFYVGSLEITKKIIGAGFYPHTKRESASLTDNNSRYGVGVYFTFGGVITFARDYDEVIKYIPLDHILLETDAPYVAPAPYRGKRNEPAYIVETAKKMAELKSVSLEKVMEVTNRTATEIFKLQV